MAVAGCAAATAAAAVGCTVGASAGWLVGADVALVACAVGATAGALVGATVGRGFRTSAVMSACCVAFAATISGSSPAGRGKMCRSRRAISTPKRSTMPAAQMKNVRQR